MTGLTAPVELTGDIYTYDGWYNNGYSFSQQCASKEIFEKNAGIYFEYFKNNYNGKFGVAKHHASNMETNEEWRYIYQKSTLDEYATKDDKTQYRFYYIADTTLVDGYYKAGAVKIFKLVYDKVVQTMVYHGFLLSWGGLSLTTGEVKLHVKKMWQPLIGIVCIALWSGLGNLCFNGGPHYYDWFFITGSTFPFVPKWLMSFAVITAVYGVVACFYLIYWLVTRKKDKQETTTLTKDETSEK